jgi:glycerol uptake facilitator-like aquaporin
MKEIVDKLSSYNFFNYLLPGTLFVVILDKITSFSFVQKDIIVAAFLYYFVGLVISRFGSLIVEPLLKKSSFLKFTDYKQFVIASKKDPKIDLLSEANNIYRSFTAMLILLTLLKFYDLIRTSNKSLENYDPYLLIGILLIMFLFSYRKQTNYITKRINANNR